MRIHERIRMIRTDTGLSRAEFAEKLSVSVQAVARWENGESCPELERLVSISKRFGVSLDWLVLGMDGRQLADTQVAKAQAGQGKSTDAWETYSDELLLEYQQSTEEGKDLSAYEQTFRAIAALPWSPRKDRLADLLYEIVVDAPIRADYSFVEPSELGQIRALRKDSMPKAKLPDREVYCDKVSGAWYGRICGCLLGKTLEGVHTNELIPFLKETGNYPMYRYVRKSEITDEIADKYRYPFRHACYADAIDAMPADDDTNYIVMGQELIRNYGMDFTSSDVARAWVEWQPKYAYCTAERVAYLNIKKGYEPPATGSYQNPYREWIGAQIRGDYFGYICPGDPEKAAELAYRDASVSHIKNGIYGEMWVSAMLACAAVESDIEKIIIGGLGEIPHTSRLYASILHVMEEYHNGVSAEDCFEDIHQRWNEYTMHGWCHTISNAMVVSAALLYGGGDYAKSICMAVQTTFDTDCNGATVGSILGMRGGRGSIGKEWTDPIQDKLRTAFTGLELLSIPERVDMTVAMVYGE